MSLTAPGIAAVVFITIDIVFFLFGLYGVYRYYTCRNHVILKKHYSEINLYMVISSIMLFWSIQGLILVWGSILPDSYQQYFITSCGCFGTYSTMIFCWRCYMNYYSIKYSNAIDTEGWKQLINPLQSTTNFFIVNKHKYGNYKYFYKHIIITISTFNILWVILRVIFNGNEKLRMIILGGLVFITLSASTILTITVRCKTPNFGDIFFIHSELKYMITIFLYAIAAMACFSVVNVFIHNIIIKTIIRLFVVGSFSSVLIAGILLQTLWVIWKNQAWINVRVHAESVLNIELELTDQVSFTPKSPQSTSSNVNKFDFLRQRTKNQENVMSDRHGWNSFIFHLQKEFSTEILLSALEMTQFKEAVYSYFTNQFRTDTNIDMIDVDAWNESCYLMIKYPKKSKKFPESHIIYGPLNELGITEDYKTYISDKNDFEKAKNELMIRGYVLYQKYVAVRSPYEINISSQTRNALVNVMTDLNEWMNNKMMNDYNKKEMMVKYLFCLFDSCIKEMMDLLRNSFARYTSTLLYTEWCKLWQQRTKKEPTNKVTLLRIPSTKQTILETDSEDNGDGDDEDNGKDIVLDEMYNQMT